MREFAKSVLMASGGVVFLLGGVAAENLYSF
jgi:hypothetical protein